MDNRHFLPQYQDFNRTNNPVGVQQFRAQARRVAWQVQGFRQTVNNGVSAEQQLELNVPGAQLLGVAFTTLQTNASDALQTEFTLRVDGHAVLIRVPMPLAIPIYNQASNFPGMPSPYPLNGNDNLTIQFDKQDAGSITVRTTLIYLPQTNFQ